MSNSDFSFVSKQIIIYLGITILNIGVIGGIFNVIVFLSLRTFRQNSCAFFLLIMSFVNIGQLIFSLFSRIMISGFLIDWTAMFLAYCKFRNYFLQVCALMSYTCMCLATIDQFLATSLHPRWRQFLNINKARFLCILFFIIWLVHGIPALILYNLSPSMTTGKPTCMVTNPIYGKYITQVYFVILTGILPISITVLFGSFAYWNVRQIPYRIVPLVRRELDKQLTSMVLVQIIFNIFAIVPYVIMQILLSTLDLTSKSINVSSLNLAAVIFAICYYLYFAVSLNN